MKKPTLYIVCGTPGSGKSTFLKKIKKDTEALVSRDEIRFSFLKHGEKYFKYENQVFNIFITTIVDFLSKGINVYADATHLNHYSRLKVLNNLNRRISSNKYNIELIYFNVPIDICLKRNAQRTGKTRVPDAAVMNMYQKLQKPNDEYYQKIAKHLWVVDENGIITKEW